MGRLRVVLKEALETAAPHDVDVGGAAQVASPLGLQTIAVAAHGIRVLAEYRGKSARGGEARLGNVIVEKPHPAGLETQDIGHGREGGMDTNVRGADALAHGQLIPGGPNSIAAGDGDARAGDDRDAQRRRGGGAEH